MYKKTIIILFILNLCSAGFVLVAPYFSKLYIDKAFLEKNIPEFFIISAFGAAVFLFSTFFNFAQSIAEMKYGVKLKFQLASQLLKKIYSLDFSFLQSRSTGEAVYRVNDVEYISNFILKQVPSFLVEIFKILVILIIALNIDVKLTLLLVILSPVFIIQRLYIQKRLWPIFKNIWDSNARLSKVIYESLSKLYIIKVLGLENFQKHIYLRALIKNIRLQLESLRWAIISSLGATFLSKTVFGTLALYGGWLIIKGNLTVGSYAAVMIYLFQLGQAIDSIGQRFEFSVKEMVSLEKFFEIIDKKDKGKLPGKKILHKLDPLVRFENFTFAYEKEKPIFKDLNLDLKLDNWVCIAGPSGCGKSTLINLILKLYDSYSGRILIGNNNLKEIELNSIRQKIAIASQQPLLFDASIRENIVYGLKHIPQEKIEEAANTACIGEFINDLPLKFETVIGEDAFRLSQGLKQRLAIARAVIREAELLILDEATSSVDIPTEEEIFSRLRNKRKNQFTVIISHRRSAAIKADFIYFFKGYGLITRGTYDNLISEDSAYRAFLAAKNGPKS